jgi:hypothetical protein
VIGVVEADFEIVTQVGPAAWPGLTPLTAHEFAEHAFEDVGETAKILRAAAILERGLAVLIVLRALLRVAEAAIGFGNRLEARFAVAAARILVRVKFHGELAVRRFDRRVIRSALNLEQLVIIDIGH